MSSWSGYDLSTIPLWIFAFLSKLDGLTPWRAARDAAAAEIGLEISDALIARMWKIRLLGDPQELDAPPGTTIRIDGVPYQPTPPGEDPA